MQEANQSSLMSLEMEDYQKSLEALQNKLSEKEKALQDSLEEVSRVDKRADDFKTQIGEWKEKKNWFRWTASWNAPFQDTLIF